MCSPKQWVFEKFWLRIQVGKKYFAEKQELLGVSSEYRVRKFMYFGLADIGVELILTNANVRRGKTFSN